MKTRGCRPAPLSCALTLIAFVARAQPAVDPAQRAADPAQPAVDPAQRAVDPAQRAADSAAAEPAGVAMTVDDAIDQALRGSFGLRRARNDLASAQSSLRAARNAFGLKLTASLDDGHAYQRNGEVAAGVFRDYVDEDQRFTFKLAKALPIGGSVELQSSLSRVRQGAFTSTPSPAPDFDPRHAATTAFTWRIPVWGGRGRRVATASLVSAETALRQQARSLVEREMQLVVSVVRSFYQILRTESVLAIDRAAVARAEENYRTYQLRLEEGLVTSMDVARAQRELKARQNAVVGDEESLQASRDQLLQLLGLPLETEFRPTGEPPQVGLEVTLPAATAEALENRADLRTQQESLSLARLEADVARSNSRPKLDLELSTGFHSVEGDDAGKWFTSAHDDRWVGGVSLTYTFGERSDDEALVRALIAADSSVVALEELQRQVVLEVRDALRNLRSLQRQVELLRDNVALAEESLRLAQLQLQEDLIRTTDLLQIQDELVRAQTDLVNARFDHAVALVALELALGRYRVEGVGRPSPFLRDAPDVSPDVPVLPRERLVEPPAPSEPPEPAR